MVWFPEEPELWAESKLFILLGLGLFYKMRGLGLRGLSPPPRSCPPVEAPTKHLTSTQVKAHSAPRVHSHTQGVPSRSPPTPPPLTGPAFSLPQTSPSPEAAPRKGRPSGGSERTASWQRRKWAEWIEFFPLRPKGLSTLFSCPGGLTATRIYDLDSFDPGL